jgi:hypothetical protein
METIVGNLRKGMIQLQEPEVASLVQVQVSTRIDL